MRRKLEPQPLARLLATAFGVPGLILGDAALAQDKSSAENADHAGIISRWDEQSLARGRSLFQLACAPCHGTNGVQTINPQARPFAVEKFQNGNDPYSMFQTITLGYKNMPSQTWMTPEQRYEVIQFIRETFVRPLNPTQYRAIDQPYLDSLPKFDPTLAEGPAAGQGRARDFGPALESQFGTNFNDALTIRLRDNVTLSYDVHRLRLAGAWQGGFLDLSRTGHYQQRGEGQPMAQGKFLPGLKQWYWAFGGRFDYPTDDLLPRGPLPSSWMKYQGHYRYNRQAILSYTIEGRQVLELPEAEQTNALVVVSHTLMIGPGSKPLRLCVAQPEGGLHTIAGVAPVGQTVPVAKSGPVGGQMVVVAGTASGTATNGTAPALEDFAAAGLLGSTNGMAWEVDAQQRLVLNIPAQGTSLVARVLCSAGKGLAALEAFGRYLSARQAAAVVDPQTLTRGGARLWPLELTVRGRLGPTNGAYALDTIPLPDDNPYGAWLRTSALAFFPDGRAVVTTYGGDVWIVSGLDHSLERVTWSRFAAGLYEPFGVQVLQGLIYVTCRNGIVRLHDLNQDGEAEFYETWYADTDVSGFFHSFNFDLQVDRRGHLYYVKPGEYTNYKLPGAVIEIWPDASQAQPFCSGFRVPNGMGILPDDRLTVSDNQGDWMPASKISLVRRGGFYGYVQNLKGGDAYGDHWAPDGGRIDTANLKPPPTFDQPIIWMPQEFDNSSSGQLWVEDARFGPLSGRLLHTSFGKGWMYYLMLQQVGAVEQAAIVALPFQFDAGLMRARVNPADGQVYATGLSGWQGPAGGKDGCLQRLRHTGNPSRMLDELKVRSDGLSLSFNFALDRAAALQPANYQLEQWNYLWSSKYGSDQYSVEHPGQKGHDRLNVAEATLSADGRRVLLTIPALRPANQVELRLNLKAADGAPWKELVYLTVNAIPDR
jgi:glucose/arabinose dehydrogenase